MPTLKRLALGAALALAGCSGNTLEGSLGEIVDLRFEDAEVQTATDKLVLGYFRKNGDGRDVAFKLAVTLDEAPVPGEEYALVPEGAGPRAQATRAVADDPVRTYPVVKVGTLVLDEAPSAGSPLSGSFRVTFGDGGDAGKGRTAFGTFAVKSALTTTGVSP